MTTRKKGSRPTEAERQEAMRQIRELPTVSVETAARALGAGIHATREQCRDGRLETIFVGRRWLVVSEPIRRLLHDD